MLIRVIRGEQLLFFAEFLESRIAPQSIPNRIEPKKGRCHACWRYMKLSYGVCNSWLKVEIAPVLSPTIV